MRGSNVGLALWLVLEAAVSFRFVSTARELFEQVVITLVSLRLAHCVLLRRPATAVQSGGRAWAVVLASVALPFAFASVCPPGTERMAATALRWTGIALFAWSASSLGTSFSVLPQARAVVAEGPYRLVRHPMYAAYIVMDAAWWTSHFAWPPFALWACEVVILLRRAVLEERCLRALPGYASYAERVKYRLYPGLI